MPIGGRFRSGFDRMHLRLGQPSQALANVAHLQFGLKDEAAPVGEMRPWNPLRALKDIEVGDYYFKQKNYRGAESRYRDALLYKPKDATATYRLGQVCERTGRIPEAVHFYRDYLKILPHGPYGEDAHKAIDKLQAQLGTTINQ